MTLDYVDKTKWHTVIWWTSLTLPVAYTMLCSKRALNVTDMKKYPTFKGKCREQNKLSFTLLIINIFAGNS